MPKLLDNNGLSHLWSKIKEYLTSWKTTNFGTGTYDNRGSLKILPEDSFTMTSEGIVLENKSSSSHNVQAFMSIDNSFRLNDTKEIHNIGTKVYIGHTDSQGRVYIYADDTYDMKYVIIGENGVKKGTRTTGTSDYITNIGSANSPFICVLTSHNY